MPPTGLCPGKPLKYLGCICSKPHEKLAAVSLFKRAPHRVMLKCRQTHFTSLSSDYSEQAGDRLLDGQRPHHIPRLVLPRCDGKARHNKIMSITVIRNYVYIMIIADISLQNTNRCCLEVTLPYSCPWKQHSTLRSEPATIRV